MIEDKLRTLSCLLENIKMKKYYFTCSQCRFTVTVEAYCQQDALGRAFILHDIFRKKIGKECEARCYELANGEIFDKFDDRSDFSQQGEMK